MRIITGAIKGTRHSELYKETNMTTTMERRDRKNLIIFYKIYHGYTPDYLRNLLPETIRQVTHYDLRNRNNLNLLRTNTSLFQNSYIPSISKVWNDLSENIKYIGSLSDFKKHLTRNDKKTPP